MDGVSTKELFELNKGRSLSYNDFIILPNYTAFHSKEMSLKTKLSRNIEMDIPIVSSPMDTVTGASMAKCMALLGGIGIIHYNNTIEEQCDMVKKVKKFENGFISEPFAKSPNDLIESLRECKYSNIPITEDGKRDGKLIGLITKYDFAFEKHSNLEIKERMTKINKLKIATVEDINTDNKLDLSKANDILLETSFSALPIIDKNGLLKYLVTRKDIQTNVYYPLATKNQNKKLMVGAAIGTNLADKDRVDSLVKAGVDVIKIDVAHAYTKFQIEMIKYIKNKYPEIDVITGNVVTGEATECLIKAGADAISVGMGIGSICTTQEVTATGRAQASAVYNCSKIAIKNNVPVIADGGISQSGHILRASVLGANSCMLGNLLAGTNESLGEWIVTSSGEKFKKYRGMGSYEAMRAGSAKRYSVKKNGFKAAEGVPASVTNKGSIYEWLPVIIAGVKQGMQKIGCKSLEEIITKSKKEKIRVELRTSSAQMEGNTHDLIMIK
ncbi:IMP dehydrogenase [Patescibacteria group bacterium]